MTARLQQGVLPFKIEKSNEPLIARVGLVLPYEMARSHVLACPEPRGTDGDIRQILQHGQILHFKG